MDEEVKQTEKMPEAKASRFRPLLRKSKYIIVAASVIIVISALFLPVYRVTGRSMLPTIEKGSIVLCTKYGSYSSGDIVAVNFSGKVLIKRIIGISGDVINIEDNGDVYVNGQLLDEPYVMSKAFGECDIELPYTVPDGKIFVMGDNRELSVDSRSSKIGCISDEFVLGKVFLSLDPFRIIK